jgi:hypothetical protein
MTDLTQFSIPGGCHLGRKKDGLNDEIPEGCDNVQAVTSLRDFCILIQCEFSTDILSLWDLLLANRCFYQHSIRSGVNYTLDFA